jgi:hypothetical protein
MAGQQTRRQLVSRGITISALGAVGLTLESPMGEVPARAAALAQPDVDVVNALVEIELLVAFVYQGTVRSGLLSRRAAAVVQEVLKHERAHLARTVLELHRLGRNQPAGPATIAAADEELAARDVSGRLGELHHERDCVNLLLGVEAVAAGAYYSALSKLSNPQLARIAAEILASEAQHATVLSRILHPHDFTRAVPSALVR